MHLLKFRYWDQLNRVFTYSDDCEKEDGIHNWQLSVFFEWAGSIDSKFIHQFSGVLDKNGKEIYEGDIVLYHCYGDKKKGLMKYIVSFFNGGFSLDSSYGGHGGVRMKDCAEKNSTCEIIGNVYENSEFIK